MISKCFRFYLHDFVILVLDGDISMIKFEGGLYSISRSLLFFKYDFYLQYKTLKYDRCYFWHNYKMLRSFSIFQLNESKFSTAGRRVPTWKRLSFRYPRGYKNINARSWFLQICDLRRSQIWRNESLRRWRRWILDDTRQHLYLLKFSSLIFFQPRVQRKLKLLCFCYSCSKQVSVHFQCFAF